MEFFIKYNLSSNIFFSKKYDSVNASFFAIRFVETFFVFTSNLYDISFLIYLVKKFLIERGLFLDTVSFSLRSIYQGMYFLDWKFYKSRNNVFLNILSDITIRQYKLKLKNIIKTSLNCSPFLFLKVLNNEIYSWSLRIKNSSNFAFVCSELDLYLYKILWKWARRRHVRRSNTWIYFKYWKFILGRWRFCLLDITSGKFIFLKYHLFASSKSYILPSSLNTFNIFNQKKISYLFFHRFLSTLEGIYFLLWKKQYGLCFVCSKSLGYSSVADLKIMFLKSYRKNFYLNDFSLLVLLHKYCICSF